MKEQSEVAIKMENTVGYHYEDLVDESSTPRSNQEIQEQLPKKPKVPQKNEGPAPISHNNEGPPDLPLWLHFMLNKDESSTPRCNQQPEGRRIPKVTEMLRNIKKDEDYFCPRVVSIGPYHHGKAHLQEFEKRKTKLAYQYCKTAKVVDLYKRVKDVAREAREFYDMEGLNTSFDDETFTIMMFLDGCFILEFIMWLLGVKNFYDTGMNKNDIANVKRDLFLLENQLPYIVLNALMEGHKENGLYEWEERIKKFISMCSRLPPADKPWTSGACSYFFRSPRKQEFQYPLHLLDMTWTRFVRQSATFSSRRRQVRDTIPSALLDKVRHCRGIRSSPKKRATPSATSDWYSSHSARELKTMGIRFRPNKTGSFNDVKFESQLFIRGVLTLPQILIDASTKSLLLNMLAFELSYTDLEDEQGVTSYMCFMDSLIKNAEDALILRSQNVIVNNLATDQDVADLFNDIASHLVPNPYTYAKAKSGIQKHCNNNFKKRIAECLHIMQEALRCFLHYVAPFLSAC